MERYVTNNGTIDKDGVEAEFDLLYTDGKYRQELGLAYVEVAKKLGIKVNLENRNWDTIVPEINSQAVLYGFGSGDPSEIYNLYSSKTLGVGDFGTILDITKMIRLMSI